ncbi:MAG: hypothetical protein R2712_14095 [Vicinamibacterales bacterium]
MERVIVHVVVHRLCQRGQALGQPGLVHPAAGALLLQQLQLAPAVDDLGVVVGADDARHLAARLTRHLHHGHRVAGRAVLVAFEREDRCPVRQHARRQQVVQPVVEHRKATGAAGRERAREAREPGVRAGGVAEDVVHDARALAPFSGPRSTASATPSQRHRTPKVWHTANSDAWVSSRMASNRR